ncbi:MAG: iron-sulfur cluster assembly protein, partial [Opitutales bacterium]
MKNQNVTLQRDCLATVIPGGDEVTLPSGGQYAIAQALGGSVTLRDATAMYRVGPGDLDALGEEIRQQLIEETNQGSPDGENPFGEERVWEALRGCFDPEIPINIVDLGLVYDLRLTETDDSQYEVSVKMTLTAQGCGMGPVIAQDAQDRITAIP